MNSLSPFSEGEKGIDPNHMEATCLKPRNWLNADTGQIDADVKDMELEAEAQLLIL